MRVASAGGHPFCLIATLGVNSTSLMLSTVEVTDHARSKSSFDIPRSRTIPRTVPGRRSRPRQFGTVVLNRVRELIQTSWLPLPCLSKTQPSLLSLRVSSL